MTFPSQGVISFAKSLLFGYLQIQEQIVTNTSKNLKSNWKIDYLIKKSKKTVILTDYELSLSVGIFKNPNCIF